MVATIVDVASLAGVSTSTVSHVLNGTRRVEPATRERVLEAVKKTAYRQDALARALRRSRTDSVGLIVSDAGEPAFADMVHGVEDAAAELGLTLLLANSAESSDRELRAVQALLDRRVDALILARAATSSSAVMGVLQAEGTPVVLLDRIYPESPFDQAGAENVEPMRRLVRHLLDQGHSRLALVAGDIRVPTLAERLEGFRQEVAASGAGASGGQIVIAGADNESIQREVGESLARPDGPTAYIACSTVLAARTLRAFRSAGKWPTDDVAFATFDGFAHSDLFEPQITTVRQPAFDVGRAAVQLLRDRLGGSAHAPRTVRLQQTIEFRASSEAVRTP